MGAIVTALAPSPQPGIIPLCGFPSYSAAVGATGALYGCLPSADGSIDIACPNRGWYLDNAAVTPEQYAAFLAMLPHCPGSPGAVIEPSVPVPPVGFEPPPIVPIVPPPVITTPGGGGITQQQIQQASTAGPTGTTGSTMPSGTGFQLPAILTETSIDGIPNWVLIAGLGILLIGFAGRRRR